MAQATLEDSLKEDPALPVAFILARNGDPLTLALRNRTEIHRDDLIQLHEASSSTSSSLGSSSTIASASCDPSIATKPTSYSTDYPVYKSAGKGSVEIEYASSLSATHGSESEAEAEHDDAQRSALFGTGAWSSSRHDDNDRCLRRHDTTRVRLSTHLSTPRKKYPVIIHRSAAREAAGRQVGEVPNAVAPLAAKTLGVSPRSLIPLKHYVLSVIILLVLLAVFLAGTLVGRGWSGSMTQPCTVG